MADQWYKWNNASAPASVPGPPASASSSAHRSGPSSSRLPPLTKSKPVPHNPIVRPPPSSAKVKAEDYQPNEVRHGLPPFQLRGGARLPASKSNAAAAPPSVIPTKPKTKAKMTPSARPPISSSTAHPKPSVPPRRPPSLPTRPPSTSSSISRPLSVAAMAAAATRGHTIATPSSSSPSAQSSAARPSRPQPRPIAATPSSSSSASPASSAILPKRPVMPDIASAPETADHTSSTSTLSDPSLLPPPKPPTKDEAKSIDYWMNLSHTNLLLLGIDRYNSAVNYFKDDTKRMLRKKRKQAVQLHPQVAAHQAGIEERQRRQNKAARKARQEANERAEQAKKAYREEHIGAERKRQARVEAASHCSQAPPHDQHAKTSSDQHLAEAQSNHQEGEREGQSSRIELGTSSSQDTGKGGASPPSSPKVAGIDTTTVAVPSDVNLKRKTPTRDDHPSQHCRSCSPPTKRSRHDDESLRPPISHEEHGEQPIPIKEDPPIPNEEHREKPIPIKEELSISTPYEVQPSNELLGQATSGFGDEQGVDYAALSISPETLADLPSLASPGVTAVKPKSELQPTSIQPSSHNVHTNDSQRYTQSWLIPTGPAVSARKKKCTEAKHNPDYRALPPDYYRQPESKPAAVNNELAELVDVSTPPVTEAAASNPFGNDDQRQKPSSPAQDTMPFSAESLAAASRTSSTPCLSTSPFPAVHSGSANGSVQDMASAVDARQTRVSTKQLSFGSEVEHLSLPQLTWKWMSGIAIGRDMSKTSAILPVAARSGQACLRTLGRGHTTNEVDLAPATAHRLGISSSATIEDVRRISSHCVAVAATSSQQIGQGSAQVSLVFARRESHDDADEDGDSDFHDDDDDDDVPLAQARTKIWRPAQIHSVPLEPRPHLAGATAVCPFLPVQDKTLSFATGGADGVVCAWRYSRGEVTSNRLHALLHRDPITSIETLPKVDLIVSGSRCHSGRGTDVVAFDGRESQIVCSWRSSDVLANLSKTSHPRVIDMSLLRADYDQHKLFDLRQDVRTGIGGGSTASRQLTKPIMSFGWQSITAPSHLGRPAFQKSYAIQGCPDGRLRLWDLRQPSEVLQEIKVGNGDEPLGDVVVEDSSGPDQKTVVVLSRSAAWRVPLV